MINPGCEGKLKKHRSGLSSVGEVPFNQEMLTKSERRYP